MGEPVGPTSPLAWKDIDLSGDQTAQAVWTPASGECIVLTGWTLTLTAAGTIKLMIDSDSGANRIVHINVPANGGESRQLPNEQVITLAADAVLKVTTTGGGDLNGTLYGYETDAED